MFWKKKKAEAKDELVSVETEEEFHAALDRGADVELGPAGAFERKPTVLITRRQPQ